MLFLSGASLAPAAERRPNVVLLLADDLGATDLGCYGSTFHQTPNLDRLALDGMRFTCAYAACTVCSPTRAALMTGQYPARLHVTDWISGHQRPKAKLCVPEWTKQLDPALPTLGEVFRAAGYATAMIGKWHLGGGDAMPDKNGFDFALANERGQPGSYFAPYGIPALADAPAGEYLPEREAEEAARWIARQKDRPFFLYMAFHAVHTPLAGKQNVVEKFRSRAQPAAPQKNPVYATLVSAMDEAVGRLRRAIEENGLAGETIVIFTSDNGGLLGSEKNPITSNPPFRAGKGSAWEGGVRVPLIIAAPGLTRAGSTSHDPVITMDLHATALDLAGLEAPRSQPADGLSLRPLLTGAGPVTRQALYWHYPHYHFGGATPYGAIRRGNLRLVEFFESDTVELYDLAADPSETHDLAAERPQEVKSLRDQLAAWRHRVGAQMPSPNPAADPAADRFAN